MNDADPIITANRRDTRRIGPYIFGALLGTGTFAKVKSATHGYTHQKVAIKAIDKNKLLQDTDDLERVRKEIAILKILHHKNIIQLYEIIESSRKIYLIMELCEEKDLFEYIVLKTKLDEGEALKFFQEIIDALDYIHSQNIAHRDLKPENLLLDSSFHLKVSDFGLSTVYTNDRLLSTPCGTPSYAPPEMLKGEDYYGLLSDVWSSGVILFAMLAGYLPFSEDDEDLNSQKIINGDYEIPGHVSDLAADLLRNILQVNPLERYDIEQIKSHPWFNMNTPFLRPGIIVGLHQIPVDERILEMVESFGYNKDQVRENIQKNNYDATTAIYYLSLKKLINEGQTSISDLSSDEYLRFISDRSNNIENQIPEEEEFNNEVMCSQPESIVEDTHIPQHYSANKRSICLHQDIVDISPGITSNEKVASLPPISTDQTHDKKVIVNFKRKSHVSNIRPDIEKELFLKYHNNPKKSVQFGERHTDDFFKMVQETMKRIEVKEKRGQIQEEEEYSQRNRDSDSDSKSQSDMSSMKGFSDASNEHIVEEKSKIIESSNPDQPLTTEQKHSKEIEKNTRSNAPKHQRVVSAPTHISSIITDINRTQQKTAYTEHFKPKLNMKYNLYLKTGQRKNKANNISYNIQSRENPFHTETSEKKNNTSLGIEHSPFRKFSLTHDTATILQLQKQGIIQLKARNNAIDIESSKQNQYESLKKKCQDDYHMKMKKKFKININKINLIKRILQSAKEKRDKTRQVFSTGLYTKNLGISNLTIKGDMSGVKENRHFNWIMSSDITKCPALKRSVGLKFSKMNFQCSPVKNYKGPVDFAGIITMELNKCLERIEKALIRRKILFLKTNQYKFRCTQGGISFDIELFKFEDSEEFLYCKFRRKQGDESNYRRNMQDLLVEITS